MFAGCVGKRALQWNISRWSSAASLPELTEVYPGDDEIFLSLTIGSFSPVIIVGSVFNSLTVVIASQKLRLSSVGVNLRRRSSSDSSDPKLSSSFSELARVLVRRLFLPYIHSY